MVPGKRFPPNQKANATRHMLIKRLECFSHVPLKKNYLVEVLLELAQQSGAKAIFQGGISSGGGGVRLALGTRRTAAAS